VYGSRRRTCRCCEGRREVTGQQRASLPILEVYVSPCRPSVPLAATGKLLPHVACETSSSIDADSANQRIRSDRRQEGATVELSQRGLSTLGARPSCLRTPANFFIVLRCFMTHVAQVASQELCSRTPAIFYTNRIFYSVYLTSFSRGLLRV